MHSRPHNVLRLSVRTIALAAATFASILSVTSSSPAQEQFTLRKIEVLGLQKLSPDQIIQISGLQTRQTVNDAAVDAAAEKLLKSGQLRSVSYRIRTAGSEMTVIFEVVEKPAGAVTGEALGEVQWIGNQALSGADLSLAFGLRPGDAADRPKISKGLEAVRKAYGRRGYINPVIEEATTRDESMRRTNYRFAIREGQQYRMGALMVTGLNPNDERRLKSRWTLAPAAVFDDSYIEEFRQSVVRPLVLNLTQRSGIRTRFEVNTKPNIEKQTVDVLITFK
jgi:outer membrane protein assembly factor BamA